MAIEIKVPQLPESVADATVLTWHHKPGEAVERDEKLVELETDKVVLEVGAPQAGVLAAIDRGEGETVAAGDVLGQVEPDGAGQGAAQAPAPETGTSEEGKQDAEAPDAEAETAHHPPPGPSVRRLLTEHGLEADAIPGSGPGGRLTKGDVLAYLEQRQATAGEAAAPTEEGGETAEEQRPPAPFETEAGRGARPEQRVPMTRLRRRIAERLVEAQHTAAILTTFNEVDMQGVMDLRARHKALFEKEHGVRLGFMSFFVKACVQALKKFPVVNASVDGNDVIYHGYYDIGIAVSSPRGLVVPILSDADTLTFAETEKGINALAAKARDGQLALEDLQGGTFSITNGGVFGSLLSTPILNPPQSAILGMHKIAERPVAVDGQVVIRPVMYLALSYDHRLIDGAEAVRFLVAIKEALEDPARLLLNL